MKTINLRKEAVIWLMLLIPFVFAAIFWNKTPDSVPTHWNLKGEPDRYSGRLTALLALPVANVVVYFILLFIPRIDPRRKNYSLFQASYQNVRLIIHTFFVCMFIYVTQSIAAGKLISTNALVVGMFLFFALLGNYMRTLRSNFFIGIRTPWTLSNDEVWRRTHELGGKIWFYSGLVMAMICLFIPQQSVIVVMFIGVTLMGLVPVVYSYFEYQKVTKESRHNS